MAEPTYAETMEEIAQAARQLDRCEPMMALLLRQLEDVRSFGFVTDPTLARRVIQDRDQRLAPQETLARAVVAFVGVWRELQAAALADMAAKFERSLAEEPDHG